MSSDGFYGRVKLDPAIPKLLVKVSSGVVGLKNLAEVRIRPKNLALKERVAVVNISTTVHDEDILMSLRLAEMLGVEEGDRIQILPANTVNSNPGSTVNSCSNPIMGSFNNNPGGGFSSNNSSGFSSSNNYGTNNSSSMSGTIGVGGSSSNSLDRDRNSSTSIPNASTALRSPAFFEYPRFFGEEGSKFGEDGSKFGSDGKFSSDGTNKGLGDLMEHASQLRSMLNEALGSEDNDRTENKTRPNSRTNIRINATTNSMGRASHPTVGGMGGTTRPTVTQPTVGGIRGAPPGLVVSRTSAPGAIGATASLGPSTKRRKKVSGFNAFDDSSEEEAEGIGALRNFDHTSFLPSRLKEGTKSLYTPREDESNYDLLHNKDLLNTTTIGRNNLSHLSQRSSGVSSNLSNVTNPNQILNSHLSYARGSYDTLLAGGNNRVTIESAIGGGRATFESAPDARPTYESCFGNFEQDNDPGTNNRRRRNTYDTVASDTDEERLLETNRMLRESLKRAAEEESDNKEFLRKHKKEIAEDDEIDVMKKPRAKLFSPLKRVMQELGELDKKLANTNYEVKSNDGSNGSTLDINSYHRDHNKGSSGSSSDNMNYNNLDETPIFPWQKAFMKVLNQSKEEASLKDSLKDSKDSSGDLDFSRDSSREEETALRTSMKSSMKSSSFNPDKRSNRIYATKRASDNNLYDNLSDNNAPLSDNNAPPRITSTTSFSSGPSSGGNLSYGASLLEDPLFQSLNKSSIPGTHFRTTTHYSDNHPVVQRFKGDSNTNSKESDSFRKSEPNDINIGGRKTDPIILDDIRSNAQHMIWDSKRRQHESLTRIAQTNERIAQARRDGVLGEDARKRQAETDRKKGANVSGGLRCGDLKNLSHLNQIFSPNSNNSSQHGSQGSETSSNTERIGGGSHSHSSFSGSLSHSKSSHSQSRSNTHSASDSHSYGETTSKEEVKSRSKGTETPPLLSVNPLTNLLRKTPLYDSVKKKYDSDTSDQEIENNSSNDEDLLKKYASRSRNYRFGTNQKIGSDSDDAIDDSGVANRNSNRVDNQIGNIMGAKIDSDEEKNTRQNDSFDIHHRNPSMQSRFDNTKYRKSKNRQENKIRERLRNLSQLVSSSSESEKEEVPAEQWLLNYLKKVTTTDKTVIQQETTDKTLIQHEPPLEEVPNVEEQSSKNSKGTQASSKRMQAGTHADDPLTRDFTLSTERMEKWQKDAELDSDEIHEDIDRLLRGARRSAVNGDDDGLLSTSPEKPQYGRRFENSAGITSLSGDSSPEKLVSPDRPFSRYRAALRKESLNPGVVEEEDEDTARENFLKEQRKRMQQSATNVASRGEKIDQRGEKKDSTRNPTTNISAAFEYLKTKKRSTLMQDDLSDVQMSSEDSDDDVIELETKYRTGKVKLGNFTNLGKAKEDKVPLSHGRSHGRSHINQETLNEVLGYASSSSSSTTGFNASSYQKTDIEKNDKNNHLNEKNKNLNDKNKNLNEKNNFTTKTGNSFDFSRPDFRTEFSKARFGSSLDDPILSSSDEDIVKGFGFKDSRNVSKNSVHSKNEIPSSEDGEQDDASPVKEYTFQSFLEKEKGIDAGDDVNYTDANTHAITDEEKITATSIIPPGISDEKEDYDKEDSKEFLTGKKDFLTGKKDTSTEGSPDSGNTTAVSGSCSSSASGEQSQPGSLPQSVQGSRKSSKDSEIGSGKRRTTSSPGSVVPPAIPMKSPQDGARSRGDCASKGSFVGLTIPTSRGDGASSASGIPVSVGPPSPSAYAEDTNLRMRLWPRRKPTIVHKEELPAFYNPEEMQLVLIPGEESRFVGGRSTGSQSNNGRSIGSKSNRSSIGSKNKDSWVEDTHGGFSKRMCSSSSTCLNEKGNERSSSKASESKASMKLQNLNLKVSQQENPSFLEYVSTKVKKTQSAMRDKLFSEAAHKTRAIPAHWKSMRKDSRLISDMLDASELGPQVTLEIWKWFQNEVTGRHVSYFLCDKASLLITSGRSLLKKPSVIEIDSGITGGPLGAVVGGHTNAKAVFREIFSKSPKEAVRIAFRFFGFEEKRKGDWSNLSSAEVSLAYRKLCLKSHPNRGGSPEMYIKIQAMLEIIRAFAYRDCNVDQLLQGTSFFNMPIEEKVDHSKKLPTTGNTTTTSEGGVDKKDNIKDDFSSKIKKDEESIKKDDVVENVVENEVENVVENEVGNVKKDEFERTVVFESNKKKKMEKKQFSDRFVSEELSKTEEEVSIECGFMDKKELNSLNKLFDEYILRQMRFKSEMIDQIAHLHEKAAYGILGVDIQASDEEIKKAYRHTAMFCHPDKGGDKEQFQELNAAYEKIMAQRGKERTMEDEDQDGNPVSFINKNGAFKKTNNTNETTTFFGGGEESDKNGENNSSENHTTTNDENGGEHGGEENDKGEGGQGKKKKKSKDSANLDHTHDDAAEAGEDDEETDEEDKETNKTDQNVELLQKVAKAADEASRFANTAAEFATQVSEAAKTAKEAASQPGQENLTKSIAHSAIVLTLTVVKAVRVVGYASLDAASHALHASKTISANANSAGCAAAAASSMSAGFEALNSASACAQATEKAAGELQAAISKEENSPGDPSVVADSHELADAATKAAEAASHAGNAAIQAAIAAAEAAKQTGKIAEADIAAKKEKNDGECKQEEVDSNEEFSEDDTENEKYENSEQPESETVLDEKGNPVPLLDEKGNPVIDSEGNPIMQQKTKKSKEVQKKRRAKRSKKKPKKSEGNCKKEEEEEATKRGITQRVNNLKLLQRLNAEILGYQSSIKNFLASNKKLIPKIDSDEKYEVFELITDYLVAGRKQLEKISETASCGALLNKLCETPLLTPFFLPLSLAISVNTETRVLRMAAILDKELLISLLDEYLFKFLQSLLNSNIIIQKFERAKAKIIREIEQITSIT